MSTSTVYATGTAKWARVYRGQEDTKFGVKYSIELFPDEKSLHNLKASGSRVKARENEDGVFFKFVRDATKEIKGEMKDLGPPKVVDSEGKAFSQLIGNGSKVTVKLAIYDSRFGKGTRLEAVRVDEHIPYEADNASASDSAEEDGVYPF